MGARKLEKTLYTVVQHSAWTARRDTQFRHGLEPKAVITVREREAVEQAGGSLFDDYSTAEAYAEKEMYPSDHTGIIPKAPGTFADIELGGQAVYVPMPVPGDPLLELLTSAACVGWDRAKTGAPYTRGELTWNVQVSLRRQIERFQAAASMGFTAEEMHALLVSAVELYERADEVGEFLSERQMDLLARARDAVRQ